MTDSKKVQRPRADATAKRQRLATATAQVLYEQGAERTTIADIARAADVPVGNVYYYFKTKGELIEAALGEQTKQLDALTAQLDGLPDPRERLKGLIGAWIGQRDTTARYGCPTGSLAAELGKQTEGGLDLAVGQVIRRLLDWVQEQYRQLGLTDAEDLALTYVAAYQGMALLSSALRDPEVMTREGARLIRELDTLPALRV